MYIRSNQDWYEANGDRRAPGQRTADIRKELHDDDHMPDSVRWELEAEARQNEWDD